MDITYSAITPMVDRVLEKDKDPFNPKEQEKRCWDQNTHT
jgi:hypothetical protein